MQVKQSVNEYCTLHKVTPQSVYARIKRGTLEAIKENGVTMVLVEVETPIQDEAKPISNDIQTILQSIINDQKKEIKRLHKTIKQLEKQRFKDMDVLRDILTGKVSAPALTAKPKDFIDVKLDKKKKKRKK